LDYAMIKHSMFAECILSVVAINSVFFYIDYSISNILYNGT